MDSETVETIEETLDAVEASLDRLDALPYKYKRLAVASGVALVIGGALVGTGIGYKIAEKRLRTKFDQLLDEEMAEAKKRYARQYKQEGYETPEKAVNVIAGSGVAMDALKSYQGEDRTVVAETEHVEVERVETTKNIFVEQDNLNEWDSEGFVYVEELKLRTKDKPYILTQDEYMHNESEYQQNSLTYFSGDGVLVDERDEPINNIDTVVGEANLERFGHGSKDNRIVYVRNDKMQMEFEVIEDKRKYTEQVLGFIEHSDRRPPIRRFRGDDD